MCVWIYIYIYIHTYTHKHIHIYYLCIYMYIHIYMYVCVFEFMHECMHIFIPEMCVFDAYITLPARCDICTYIIHVHDVSFYVIEQVRNVRNELVNLINDWWHVFELTDNAQYFPANSSHRNHSLWKICDRSDQSFNDLIKVEFPSVDHQSFGVVFEHLYCFFDVHNDLVDNCIIQFSHLLNPIVAIFLEPNNTKILVIMFYSRKC